MVKPVHGVPSTVIRASAHGNNRGGPERPDVAQVGGAGVPGDALRSGNDRIGAIRCDADAMNVEAVGRTGGASRTEIAGNDARSGIEVDTPASNFVGDNVHARALGAGN